MDTVIARLGKPHGIKGEFTVEVRTDAPDERFVVGETFGTDPDIGTLTLSSARWHRDRLLLSFAEVGDRTRAEEIRNTLLLGEQVDEDDEDVWLLDGLIGLEVLEDGVRIGVITEVTNGVAQDLLHVEHIQGHEVLIPFVEAIVPEVDIEAGRIVVTPPAGLLDAE